MLKIKKHTSIDQIQSQRFEYSEGVSFWVRPITSTILRELRKQCTTTRMELNSRIRKMEPVDDLDEEKHDNLVSDYILEKWEGVGGEDGEPLPVSLDSKKLILDQIPLREFIWSAAQSLDTTEAEQKNS